MAEKQPNATYTSPELTEYGRLEELTGTNAPPPSVQNDGGSVNQYLS